MNLKDAQAIEAVLTTIILSGKGISQNAGQRRKEVEAAHAAALDVIGIVSGKDEELAENGEHVGRELERVRQQSQARGIEIEKLEQANRKLTEQLADGESTVRAAKAVIEDKADDVQRAGDNDTRTVKTGKVPR